MRLIDADACIDYIRNNNQHAWEALAYAPTIDAVEIVRCKDCRYAEHREQMPNQIYCHRDKLSLHSYLHDDDDFCKYGERREE